MLDADRSMYAFRHSHTAPPWHARRGDEWPGASPVVPVPFDVLDDHHHAAGRMALNERLPNRGRVRGVPDYRAVPHGTRRWTMNQIAEARTCP